MTRSSQKDSVQVVLNDQTVEMNVSKAQAWTGSPVPQEALLDVLRFQGLAKQSSTAQVDHAGGQIVAGTPVGVHLAELLSRQPVCSTSTDTFDSHLHLVQHRCHKSPWLSKNLKV